MKQRILSVLVLLLALVGGSMSAAVPGFSTDTEEHWYHLIFKGDGLSLHASSNDLPVTTNAFNGELEQQRWKLVGTPESFILVNGTGRVLSFKGKYFRSTKTLENAVSLRLHALTGAADGEAVYEIEYPERGAADSYLASSGSGKNMAPKAQGDPSNIIGFYPVTDAFGAVTEYPVEGAQGYAPQHRHTLWYTFPVTSVTVGDPWMEYALPIGNGEFGAMVYGGIRRDRLQFNDKSVWTGSPTVRGCYQNFGDVLMFDRSGIFSETAAVKDYVRFLDLSRGVAGVRYASPDGTVTFTREYIASYPDKVVAVHITASRPGELTMDFTMRNALKFLPYGNSYGEGTCAFEGKLDLVDYKAKMQVVPEGGTMTTADGLIQVDGADAVTVYLAGATNFDQHSPSYITDAAAMRSMVDARLERAAAKGWDAILADHEADHKALYGRAELAFGGTANDIDTESLVKFYNEKSTPSTHPRALMLEELYYSYGRYLLIGCSRGMDSPANLQGIWNHSATPEWQSDIHSNINVQMNYWPAEITNLSELHMPYLNYIHSMAIEHDQWKEYARRSGMSAGWTCFTQNNIFGHSDYAENYVIANAWYTSHMWQHYRYTLDRDFLRDKAMPVMKSCCDFWLERLREAPDGTLVAPAEWSPEHGPGAEDGTAHAQQIVADLFSSTLDAIEVLGADAGVSEEFAADLRNKYDRLDKGLATETYTGAWGETLNGITAGTPILREWKTSAYTAGENGHRHQSHLMCLYPFAQVTPESPFFEPAVNSLRLRGDVSTGWSLGWRINLWARALDGDHAHSVLHNALRHATAYTSSQVNGGIYYNLFDSHSPFQIDGNFGYTAGVTEMLLQSYNGVIRLLPALPADWADGSIRGIRAENNFTVDQTWGGGQLLKATVTSGSGRPCTLVHKDISSATVMTESGQPVAVTADGTDRITFETTEGGVYTVLTEAGAGVESVSADAEADGPAEYYTVQGVRVAEPSCGVYIVKRGSRVTKEVMK